MATHYHTGHNIAGYLPESDVDYHETVRDALGALAYDLDRAADHMADDDDLTDDQVETVAEVARHLMWLSDNQAQPFAEFETADGSSHKVDVERVAHEGWSFDLDDGRALPIVYWLNPCTNDECEEFYA